MKHKKTGKVQSKRRKKTSSRKRKKTIVRIILISSVLTLIVGFTFAIIQFLGESFGFIPEIQLGSLSWGRSGDVIIIFVIGFLSSIFLGSFLVLYFMRNQMKGEIP